MIGPTDLLRPSPAPYFKTFQIFLICCPKRPNFNTNIKVLWRNSLKFKNIEIKWPTNPCKEYLRTYLRTYLFTPWSKVLLEKLAGSQLVKKFPAFYGTRKFITAYTSVCHLSLSQASSIQSMPSHPTSWRSILIVPPIYTWVSQVVFFHHVSPPKPWIRLSYLPYALHAPPISFFSILSPEQYWVSSTDH